MTPGLRRLASGLALVLIAGCAVDRAHPVAPQVDHSLPGHSIVYLQLGFSRDAGRKWAKREPKAYQLNIYAQTDSSGARPIRDPMRMRQIWDEAAARKCGSKGVEITAEPQFLRILENVCTPFPGETNCAPAISGEFLCR